MLGVVGYTLSFENFSLLFYHFRGQLTCVKVYLILIFLYLFKTSSYLYLIILGHFKKLDCHSITIAVFERKWGEEREKNLKGKLMTYTNIKCTISEIL